MSKRSTGQFPQTDSGNAELIARLFGKQLRFNHARQCWLIFRNGHWEVDRDGEAYRLSKRAARERAKAGNDLKDDNERQEAVKWALHSEQEPRLRAALKLAQSTPPLADDGKSWDSDPFLLGVQNGVINLKTGKLREGRPEDRITLRASVPYDPSAKCPRFEQFLREVFRDDRELIGFVQRAIGYSLTGAVTEQCLFLCYGEGANGKSKLLEAIRHVIGGLAHNLPFSAFELAGRSTIPNDLAGLVSKRFVTSAETNENVRFNEARLKALSGGDTLTARFLYGEFFSFEPTAKFWLAFNHKPRVTDDSHGFWRRIRLVPFMAKFEGSQDDKGLPDKLKAEARGILNWAVQGCLSWQSEGLGEPSAVNAATKAYREESDPLAEFLDEQFERSPKGRVPSSLLCEAYGEWAQANGEERLAPRALASRLGSRGFTAGRDVLDGRRVRVWCGLKRRDYQADTLDAVDSRTDRDASIQ
jgi:putative DNA primase/helicase